MPCEMQTFVFATTLDHEVTHETLQQATAVAEHVTNRAAHMREMTALVAKLFCDVDRLNAKTQRVLDEAENVRRSRNRWIAVALFQMIALIGLLLRLAR